MQNTKKLLFIAILATTAFVANESSCAAEQKRIQVKDRWGCNRIEDVLVAPGSFIYDVKQALENAQGIPPEIQVLFNDNLLEFDDNDPVDDIERVYLKIDPARPNRKQGQQQQPLP